MDTGLKWLLIGGLACALACDGGDGGSDGETDSGTDGPTTSTSSTTDDTASSLTPGESDSNSNGSSSTSDGTASGSSSGGSSGSSTGDFGSSSGSGSTGGSTSTGGEAAVPYGGCPGGDDEMCLDGWMCQSFGMGPLSGAHFCTQSCDPEGDPCPDAPEGDAMPRCRAGGGPKAEGICLLTCTQETTCPSGMDCVLGGGMGGEVGNCVWPGDKDE